MADMPSAAPTPSVQTSAPSATSGQAAKADKSVDPKSQVKAVTESIKTGQPATAETPKKFKVKVDGKELEVGESDLVESYQMRQVLDKKRSEADKVMQEYQKLFQAFKQDPVKFMKATGVDFEGLATQYLAKKAEEAMKDPKELELERARKEAETYKKYVEEQKAAQEKAQKEAEVASVRQQIHSEIIQAIEEAKDLGLPVDEELVISVAQKMMLQDLKQKPLSAKEALPKAYESSQKYLRSLASKMDGEPLVKWLGDDVVKKIRKYDLAQLKAKRTAATPQPQARVEPKTDNKPQKKYMTWSEFKAQKLDALK